MIEELGKTVVGGNRQRRWFWRWIRRVSLRRCRGWERLRVFHYLSQRFLNNKSKVHDGFWLFFFSFLVLTSQRSTLQQRTERPKQQDMDPDPGRFQFKPTRSWEWPGPDCSPIQTMLRMTSTSSYLCIYNIIFFNLNKKKKCYQV